MKGSALTNAQGDTLVGLPERTDSAHGLAVGDVARNSANGVWTKAQADSEANIGVGLALVIDVADADNFTPCSSKLGHDVTLTAHGLGSFGQKLYLSDATPGLIATSPGAFSVYLGYVIDADTIRWEPGALI